jgi:hypothetical protein
MHQTDEHRVASAAPVDYSTCPMRVGTPGCMTPGASRFQARSTCGYSSCRGTDGCYTEPLCTTVDCDGLGRSRFGTSPGRPAVRAVWSQHWRDRRLGARGASRGGSSAPRCRCMSQAGARPASPTRGIDVQSDSDVLGHLRRLLGTPEGSSLTRTCAPPGSPCCGPTSRRCTDIRRRTVSISCRSLRMCRAPAATRRAAVSPAAPTVDRTSHTASRTPARAARGRDR